MQLSYYVYSQISDKNMFKEHSKEIGNILRTLCEYENVEVVEVSIGKIMYICV